MSSARTDGNRTDDIRSGRHESAAAASGDVTAGREAGAREMASASAASIADPAPLGLAGFALTTFLLSLVNAKLIPAGAEPVVFGLALAYGGLAQLLAGMWEFRKGNTFGSTAFTSYGAFWISFWALVTFYVPKIPEAAAGTAVGWYLVAWGIFTTLMWFASFRTTAGLVLLFALLAATFFFLGAGDLSGVKGVGTFGGWLGLVTAVVAWYLALAGVMASTFGRPVLPNPPLNRG
jgi:succinate-acetate transporter protein